MPETTLVTAATGTVGREVVRQLLASGVQVRAGGRAPSKPAFLGCADYIVLDFDQPQTTALAFKGIQRTFLLTPLNERMVDIGCGLVERAKAWGVEHIVRLSVMGAGSFPSTELARVHRTVEEAIEASGLQYTFLRPNAFMQNYLTAFGESIRLRGLLAMPQGHGAVSVVDVRDVAAVAVAALTDARHQGQSYELTGPEALSNNDVAQIFSELTHRSIRYVDTSEMEARKMLLSQGVSGWLVKVLLELYAISRQGMAAGVSSAVQEVLGRSPINFRQFATDYADHFR
ncbi:MAG: NmrA family NAD(P)-binding protein [Gammaproteobacteria bacterium]